MQNYIKIHARKQQADKRFSLFAVFGWTFVFGFFSLSFLFFLCVCTKCAVHLHALRAKYYNQHLFKIIIRIFLFWFVVTLLTLIQDISFFRLFLLSHIDFQANIKLADKHGKSNFFMYFCCLILKIIAWLLCSLTEFTFAPNNYSTNEWRRRRRQQHWKHITGIHLFLLDLDCSFVFFFTCEYIMVCRFISWLHIFLFLLGTKRSVASDLWFPINLNALREHCIAWFVL